MSVHKESAFEANIEAHLLANGWNRVDPGSYRKVQGLFPAELVAFLRASQPKEWELLTTRLGGEPNAETTVLQRVADELDRRGTVDVLRGTVKLNGVTLRTAYFHPANTLTPELTERYQANRLGVVRQLHHSESQPADSLDLVLVVNGIPTATAELKNPITAQTVEHAMTQYRTDRNPADLIFAARTLVHFAVDPHRVYMTTRLARDDTRFLPFNQGSGGAGAKGGDGNPPSGTGGYATAYLWKQVWQRDAWLDLIGSFVHAEDGRLLFPRFHQWHAVRSMVAATLADGAGTDRLVQHSAGSGKSNTIAWTAHALSRLHGADNRPVFDKVVIVTDRVVLDRQLQQTVAGLDHTPGTIQRIDQHSDQLRAALEGHTARIVVTTLQKFPVIAEVAAQVAGRTFAVVIDEAHSSTSGDAMKQLKQVLTRGDDALAEAERAEASATGEDVDADDVVDAINASAIDRGKHPNLSFIAFTATPKPKTLNLFGQRVSEPDGSEVHRPFHLYSMRQAIEEGFILDVLGGYTTYATYYKLANHTHDDPDVPVGKARAALARFVSLHPSNLAQKAEIIVEHFRHKTAGKINGAAKAMVVTRSRLHAVRYKRAIDAYLSQRGYDSGDRPVRALVAFSGSLSDPDAPELTYTEAMLNGFGEAQLPKRFAGSEFHLLVVAEKYQTGFDQPLLHTMYVDKVLSGVKAVQTLSRLNRTHPGKDDTFVLDFANSAEGIQDAFRPFFEETLAAPTDPNDLYTLERSLRAAGVLAPDEMRAAVAALLSGDQAQQGAVYASVDPAVQRFVALDADPQDEFRRALTSFLRAYGFLAQIMPWTDPELEELFLFGKILALALPAGDDHPPPLVSNAVLLTHLRTAAVAEEENLALTHGSDQPGVALPGQGAGRQHEVPTDKLSVLIATMNERFGLELTDADRLLFEQQRAVVQADDELRLVALHNDREQYEQVLGARAEDLVVDRLQANQVLFDSFFSKPEFKVVFLDYLASTYEEFRAEAGA